MRRLVFLLALFFCATFVPARTADLLNTANALPLSLDDRIQFRKTELFVNDPKIFKPTVSPAISFERQRVNFKAITEVDRRERFGNYFTFFWRADRRADLTLRLEYRQENLGNHVQARELNYPNAKGSIRTKFAVVGDDYVNDGRVTAWRAVLIEEGKIVALTQSYLWN
jgi:hypothetical protein